MRMIGAKAWFYRITLVRLCRGINAVDVDANRFRLKFVPFYPMES